MKNYSKVGNRTGKPAYRTSSKFRNKKYFEINKKKISLNKNKKYGN